MAVYDNMAFLSKKKPDKYGKPSFIGGTPSTISGENLGLFSYDIEKGVEEKVFDAYKYNSNYRSDYALIEIDGEPCFIYEGSYGGESNVEIYTRATGWKDIFSSRNQIREIQYLNGRIFVFLFPENSIYSGLLCYEITMTLNEYIGICECYNPIVFSSSSGKLQYVDDAGNIKDFL